MGILNKIKEFFKGGDIKEMPMKNIVSESTLLALYDDFIMSEKWEWMEIGKHYYKGKHDILDRKKFKYLENGSKIEDLEQPNNKLYFNYDKFIVDQKVNYSLSKPPTFNCQDEEYLKALEKMLENNDFDYYLSILGTQASNAGIGWIQVYIDEEGEFKFILIPAQQCIPLWTDDLHTSLQAMIRGYQALENFNIDNPEPITIIEYWTATGMQKFKVDGTDLIQMNDFNLLTTLDGKYTGESAHYKNGNWLKSWDKVPFIPFRNNITEEPDIRQIKGQIDAMNLVISDVVNALEQQRDRIVVLNNAQGTDLDLLLNNLKLYGVLLTQNIDGSGSTANVLDTPMNCEGALSVFNTLKSTLMETAQAANTDQDWKTPPAAILLELLYRELDIKCNGFEKEFKKGIKDLQYFFKQYLNEHGQATNEVATVTFNRNTPQNNTEKLEQISKGVGNGTLSKKTGAKLNPLVDDPEEELENLKQENKEYNFDNIPYNS